MGLIEQMESSHKTMRECIRKFDEDISIKANKSHLMLFMHDVQLNYIKNEYKSEVNKIIES